MSTFVLVHGAFHGGWCWHKVVSRLEARGHKAVAPDMPGHGIDRTPLEGLTLPDIVARIVQVIDDQNEPVVLVGHSYGGAVITQTAEERPDKIRKLVYVTAILPRNGMSAITATQDDHTSDLAPTIDYAPDSQTSTIKPERLRELFYAQCSDEDVALARLLLVPEALSGTATPVSTSEARFGRIPRFFVECLKDRAISPARQKALYEALPCERVFTLDTDHSPFFSTPDALSDILANL